jgi:hypothetical protein
MEYQINRGEVLTFFTTGATDEVAVTKGRIWLTKYADHRDYCLEAGTRLPVENADWVVIEALDNAMFSVIRRDAPTALRIALSLSGQALAGQQ